MTTHTTPSNMHPTRPAGVWKVAWPLLLCAASAGVALACVRLTGGTDAKASPDRFTVEHVRVKTDKPFAEVSAAFERRLGKFDPAVYQRLREGGDPEEVRGRLKAMAGPSGFMLFRTSDHGALLRLVGQRGKAVQYLLGNPLFAVEMTRHAIRAGLYAPLRVLIYETEEGKTGIEYDRPSSLFGQFGDARVDEMAVSLDRKLADLAAEAIR
jgi:uncharacterized protein (DUF302 family)